MSAKRLILAGPSVYAEDETHHCAAIVIDGGLIAQIATEAEVESTSQDVVLHFPASYSIVPGFIDLHVHGAQGADVMDATPEALATISQALAQEGTTAFLATTMTTADATLDVVLKNISHYQKKEKTVGAELLGVHLEGPFISPIKKGAQVAEFMRDGNISLIKHWQALAKINLVTLAPECVDTSFINFLRDENIIASIGHTNATYEQTNEAIAAGCTHATHLFNAMSQMHQREPGAAVAILLNKKVYAEIIADGIHVHPGMVQLSFAMKGCEQLILVTDAMRAKCMQDGCYDLGGQAVNVKNNSARLSDGTLAGSVLTMPEALKNMHAFTGAQLRELMQMVSANPAKQINLFARKGSLAPGKDADIVVLDEDLRVVLTICNGIIVHQKTVNHLAV